MSLKYKIIASTLCLTLVPAVVFSVLFFFNYRKSLEERAIKQLNSMSEIQKSRVDTIIARLQESTKLISSRTQMRISLFRYEKLKDDKHKQNIERILSDAINSVSNVVRIDIFNQNNQLISSVGDQQLIKTYPISEIKDDAKLTQIYENTDHEVIVTIQSKLTLNENKIGSIVVHFVADWFEKIASDYTGLGKTGETIIGRKDNNNKLFFLGALRFEDDRGLIHVNKSHQVPMAKALSGVEGVLEYGFLDYRSVSVFAVTRYLKRGNIGIVVKIDESEIYAQANEILYFALVVLFIYACLMTPLVLYLTRPLINMLSAAKEIVDNRYSINTKTHQKLLRDSKSKNELSVLALSLVQLMEKLRRTNKNLEKASEAKTNFLANMSHEIRTPMNAIIGMGELLSETELNVEQKKYVSILVKSGESLLALINDILDLSKIEAGELKLNQEVFDLEEVCNQVVDLMAIRAQHREVELILYFDHSLSKLYLGDSKKIRQILVNLIGNSIKFTHSGGYVYLSVSSKVIDQIQQVEFEIKDTGIGIPKDKIEVVFDSFSQADSKITKKYGGTGLGLALTKRFTLMMGGIITVDSVEGEGSTFNIKIPLKPKAEKIASISEHLVDLHGKAVLVIDDNRINRLIIKRYIEPKGMNVTETSSAQEAIQLLSGNGKANYDLYLLDVHMPGMSGYDFVEWATENRKDTIQKIIMLTSGNCSQAIQLVEQKLISCCLQKPIKREDLLETIQSTLQGKIKLMKTLKTKGDDVAESNATNSNIKILLAYDNPDNVMIIKHYLKNHPYHVTSVSDGMFAVQEFQAKPFDIVLMDLQMDHMDGYEAIKKIREWESKNNKPKTPVIAFTAYALDIDQEKVLKSGFDAHLAKPVKKADLLKILSENTVELVEENTLSQDDEFKPLIAQYLVKRKSDLKEMKNALKKNDLHTIKRICHNVKGTAATFTFAELGEIAARLEEAAEKNDKIQLEAHLKSYAQYLNQQVDVKVA